MALVTHLELESSANVFLLICSNRPSETQTNNGLRTQILFDSGATGSIINRDTITEIERIQPLVVMPLEKSLLYADGYGMPMKGKVLIQSAFDVDYTCVI